jgi:hypothetical protein
MIVVAGPPGSGKTSSFPVTAFGVDAFNIVGEGREFFHSCGLVRHGQHPTVEAAQYLVLLEAVDEDVEERRVCGVLFSGHLVLRSEEAVV